MGFYKSKFEGPCALETCGTRINVGDPITWNPKVKPVQYFHLACMEKIKAARAAAGVPAKKGGVALKWTTANGGMAEGARCRFRDSDAWATGTVAHYIQYPDGDESITVKRDDGKHGGGRPISGEPYNGGKGWSVTRPAGGRWGYDLEVEGIGKDDGAQDVVEPEIVWAPAPRELEVNMEVSGKYGESAYTGRVYKVGGRSGDLKTGDAIIKQSDGRDWIVSRRADGSWDADGSGGGVLMVAISFTSGAGTSNGNGSHDGGETGEGKDGGAPKEGGTGGEGGDQEDQKDSKEDSALKKLAEALQPYLKSGTDEAAVKAIIGDSIVPLMNTVNSSLEEIREIAKTAAKEGGGVLSIEIKKEGEKEVKTITGVHKDFDTLLKLIQVGDHVYMWGPPGSGKSTAARQVSEALSIEFGYISLNPQTPDSRILGFLDAGGHYRSTVFRHMYENGGVMCIDEMDNAAPSLCVTINSGLESDLMAFPDRMVKRSPKFVLVATGNTTGRGANAAFPERRPFDSAFAERFSFLEWDYDQKMERAIALGFNPKAGDWIDWVVKVRQFCKKTYPRVIVSPRASFKGAKLLGKFKEPEIAEMVLFKGLDRDTVKAILKGVA